MSKMCRFIPIIVGLAVPVDASADALQATFIVKGLEIAAVEPRLTANELRGRSIYLGDVTGERGQARTADGSHLDRDMGRGPFLGYLGHAEFLRLENTTARDPRVLDVATAELRKQGAPKDRAIDVTMLAHVDFDADGTEEIVVRAGTVRDPNDPYLQRPHDIEGIFVLSQKDGIWVWSWLVTEYDPGQRNGARTLMELRAIGRGPSGVWDLLVEDKAQYIGKLPPGINIMIDGKPMDQTNEIKLRRTDYKETVYHWSNSGLSPSDLLEATYMHVCSIADCKPE